MTTSGGAEETGPLVGVRQRVLGLATADHLTLAGLTLLAAALRLASFPDRGMWDADQGRDLLVLRSLLIDGQWPLLGPITSIGGIHHGAAYYYLLAPAAAVARLDPTAVGLLFAAAGIALVGLVWWLARGIGGPIAGLVAGLLVAASPTAIAASVTIWNPNLVAPASALALAAAWRAWAHRQAGWWIVALGAAALTAQLHVVAWILVIPVVALLIGDFRRSSGVDRRRILAATLGGTALAGLVVLPLIVHEAAFGFGELRAALEFLQGERAGAALDPVSRLIVALLRIVSWPVAGPLVEAPAAASVVAGLVAAAAVWRWRASAGEERTGTRWLVATLAWSAVALAVIVPDLAVVVQGLPNDQYHAFTDPIVPVLLGLGAGGLAGRRPVPTAAGGPVRTGAGGPALAEAPAAGPAVGPAVGPAAGGPALTQAPRGRRLLVVALAIGVLVVELARLPPLRDPNGGWPAARAAAERIVQTAGDRTLLVAGLPAFKPADGLVFPLLRAGAQPAGDAASAGALVVVCDRLFEVTMGAACGGQAEQAVERQRPAFSRLVDRFDLSGRTLVSVYLRAE